MCVSCVFPCTSVEQWWLVKHTLACGFLPLKGPYCWYSRAVFPNLFVFRPSEILWPLLTCYGLSVGMIGVNFNLFLSWVVSFERIVKQKLQKKISEKNKNKKESEKTLSVWWQEKYSIKPQNWLRNVRHISESRRRGTWRSRRNVPVNRVNLICAIPGNTDSLKHLVQFLLCPMLLTMDMLTPHQLPIFSDGSSTCRKKNHNNHRNALVSPSGNSPKFKFIIFLTDNINICNHLAQVHFQTSFLSLCVCVGVHTQTHTRTCLLFVYVEQVWGCTHGWLSNRCWCSASAARPCSWIIKPRAIMAFTQINQSMLDANCNWVSGYFLQHTWACSKRWVSIMNGACPTQGV